MKKACGKCFISNTYHTSQLCLKTIIKRNRIRFKRSSDHIKLMENSGEITYNELRSLRSQFEEDETKVMKRNVVTSVGSILACTNSEESKEINHVFLNTVKAKNLRATDQGSSGRCWMFAGLNMFRHHVINAMGIPDFQYSATYLFFWDKFERSNMFLQQFIDNKSGDWSPGERRGDHHMQYLLSDGGFFSFFSNLVMKYGVVPYGAMPETYQSDWSDDMNSVLCNRLSAAVSKIISKRGKWSREKMMSHKEQVMRQIYDSLVLFLGQPPDDEHTFTWSYSDDDGTGSVMCNLTPLAFKDLMMPSIDLYEFVVLVNIPNFDYNKSYQVKDSSNMVGGKPITLVNLPIRELKKYSKMSILKGFPVWFAGDVSKGFHPYRAALSNDLMDDQPVFGRYDVQEKGERIKSFNLDANHAMLLTGININDDETVKEWQVENSWGYWDNEIPGLDGFMCMTDEWFDNCLIQVVVHSRFLSRSIQRVLRSEPVMIEPWSCMAPAVRVNVVNKPDGWLDPSFNRKSKRQRVK